MCSLWNFANDRIRTVDLWYPKQPLCERSHNHCPGHLHCQNFNLFCLRNENKRKRGRELHILEGHKLEQMFSNKTKKRFFSHFFQRLLLHQVHFGVSHGVVVEVQHGVLHHHLDLQQVNKAHFYLITKGRDHCILGHAFNTLSPHFWCIW